MIRTLPVRDHPTHANKYVLHVSFPDPFTNVAHGITLAHLPNLRRLSIALRLDRIKDADLAGLCRSTLRSWTSVERVHLLSLHAIGRVQRHDRKEYTQALRAIGPVVEDIVIVNGSAVSEEEEESEKQPASTTAPRTPMIRLIIDDDTDAHKTWWESEARACLPRAHKSGRLQLDLHLDDTERELFVVA